MAESSPDQLTPELARWAENRIAAALTYTTETESSEEDPTDENVVVLQGQSFRLALLIHPETDQLEGVVVLRDAIRGLPAELLRSLAVAMRARAGLVTPHGGVGSQEG